MLNRILIGNILSSFKGLEIRLRADEKLMIATKLEEKSTKFKDKDMLAFSGSFVVNADLPFMMRKCIQHIARSYNVMHCWLSLIFKKK